MTRFGPDPGSPTYIDLLDRLNILCLTYVIIRYQSWSCWHVQCNMRYAIFSYFLLYGMLYYCYALLVVCVF